jgi:polysaccharide export outer membrane protein
MTLCAAAGCQTTLLGSAPPAPSPAAAVSLAPPVRSSAASARKAAGEWARADRPAKPDPAGLLTVGYPSVSALSRPGTQKTERARNAVATGPGPSLEPSAASRLVDGPEPPKIKEEAELHPPRPLPDGGAVLLDPRLVPHPIGNSAAAPRELAKQALPAYIIEPPDILLVEAILPKNGAAALKYEQPIRGQHLVRPDGTIGLGIYGSVFVANMTIDEARRAIAEHLKKVEGLADFKVEQLNVDVLAYNSKFYYVITDGAGYGEQVYPLPFTGSETVLDAIGRIGGLPAVADKSKVWVARRGPGPQGQVLPVDWASVAQLGGAVTNYQVMPGDRIYVHSDKWLRKDTWLAKRLAPIERLLGITLLGGETYNTISGRTRSR